MKKIHILLIIVLIFVSCQKEYEKGKTSLELGQMYSEDKELYDYHKAIKYYEKAIKNGEAKAYYELAQMYMSINHFYPRDYRKAKEYLELSLNNGDKRAYSDLGIIEMKGFVSEKNELKAEEYFKKARMNDYLVRLYSSDDSKIKNYKKAFDIALKNVSENNDFFKAWLAYSYEKGLGTSIDLRKSKEYYNSISSYNHYESKPYVFRKLKTQNSNVYRVAFRGVVFNGGFINLSIPTSINGIQTVKNLKSNLKPVIIKNNSVSFRIKPNMKETEIIVTVDVELLNDVGNLRKLNEPWKVEQRDLSDSLYVNAKNEFIEKIAKSLKRENDIDTLANIAHFTSKAIVYKAIPEEKNALSALKNKTGDCTESSYIFASLARNLGYPTKLVTGIFLSGGAHMWNEVYLKEYGWISYDSLNNYSSLHNGLINPLIIFGNENSKFGFYGGILRKMEIGVDLLK